eukprot:4471559-Lingulodinium_polyedra.AAC.1
MPPRGACVLERSRRTPRAFCAPLLPVEWWSRRQLGIGPALRCARVTGVRRSPWSTVSGSAPRGVASVRA